MNKNSNLNNNYKCNICIKFYSSHSSLCNHNKKFHNNIVNKYKCIVNNKKYIVNKSNCIVNENNKNKCNYCNKLLSCKQAKSQHHKICKHKIQIINNNFDELKNENRFYLKIKDF